jgi:hypothetical protein
MVVIWGPSDSLLHVSIDLKEQMSHCLRTIKSDEFLILLREGSPDSVDGRALEQFLVSR